MALFTKTKMLFLFFCFPVLLVFSLESCVPIHTGSKTLSIVSKERVRKNIKPVNNHARVNESDRCIKTLNEATQPYKALRKAGRCFYNKDNYDSAEHYLRLAIKEKPGYAMAWNNLGWVYNETKRYSKMKDAFEKAIMYRDTILAWDYIGLGRAYYNLQDYSAARQRFNKALTLKDNNGSHADAKKWLGFTAYKLKEIQTAETYFYEYISIAPERHAALKRIGRFYYLYGNYDLAESYLKRAVAEKPDYGLAWNNLGWLYWKQERYTGMKEMFQKAVGLTHHHDNIYNYLGLGAAWYYLGNTARSEDYFNKASLLAKNDSNTNNLNSFRILLALKQKDFQRVEHLWQERPSLQVHTRLTNTDQGKVLCAVDRDTGLSI